MSKCVDVVDPGFLWWKKGNTNMESQKARKNLVGLIEFGGTGVNS